MQGHGYTTPNFIRVRGLRSIAAFGACVFGNSRDRHSLIVDRVNRLEYRSTLPPRLPRFPWRSAMGKRARTAHASNTIDALRWALKSQYHATLAMLRAAINRCPEDLWASRDGHANPVWRIAYHTLYYTHLYLQPNNWIFHPWEHHQRGIQRMDELRKSRRPYTKAEVLAYWRICEAMVDDAVDALDLDDPQSGFSWYKVPKMEHQIINIRHIQYHQAQLADRLRLATGTGIGWADARRGATERSTGTRRTVLRGRSRGSGSPQ